MIATLDSVYREIRKRNRGRMGTFRGEFGRGRGSGKKYLGKSNTPISISNSTVPGNNDIVLYLDQIVMHTGSRSMALSEHLTQGLEFGVRDGDSNILVERSYGFSGTDKRKSEAHLDNRELRKIFGNFLGAWFGEYSLEEALANENDRVFDKISSAEFRDYMLAEITKTQSFLKGKVPQGQFHGYKPFLQTMFDELKSSLFMDPVEPFENVGAQIAYSTDHTQIRLIGKLLDISSNPSKKIQYIRQIEKAFTQLKTVVAAYTQRMFTSQSYGLLKSLAIKGGIENTKYSYPGYGYATMCGRDLILPGVKDIQDLQTAVGPTSFAGNSWYAAMESLAKNHLKTTRKGMKITNPVTYALAVTLMAKHLKKVENPSI